MTALKKQFQRARAVLQSLVQGLNPESEVELAKEEIIHNINVNRAMSTAVMAIDQVIARLSRREMLPDKVGKGVVGGRGTTAQSGIQLRCATFANRHKARPHCPRDRREVGAHRPAARRSADNKRFVRERVCKG